MTIHRTSIAAFVAGLVVVSAAFGGVSPSGGFTAEAQPSAYAQGDLSQELAYLGDSPQTPDLRLWVIEFSPVADTDAPADTQPVQTLEHGPSSFSFGLSALLGLGLCASAHLGKRLRLGCVPDWFHDGGPYQIGHSHAATPQSLCSPAVCCFIQPASSMEHTAPPYRLRTIVSLWRESQFTPSALASRGPPLC